MSAELPAPYTELLERRLAEGHGEEGTTGAVDLLDLRRGEGGGGLVPRAAGESGGPAL
ncbi:hypothetical protein [Streptomyces sp. NPDC048224]|uniref:hypothetical protein n=1 Tax=Streptomyces sp. NPDC048224 TaxID=3154500 RepID=UPI0033D8CCE8